MGVENARNFETSEDVTPQLEILQSVGNPESTPNGSETPKRVDLLGEDKGTARHWPTIAIELPQDYETNNEYRHVRKFVRAYTAAQVRIAEGQETRGRRVLRSLRDKVGFGEFADLNQPLLAAIDIATRGINTQRDEALDPVKPSFKNIKVPQSLK